MLTLKAKKKRLAYTRKWRAEHPEKVRGYSRSWNRRLRLETIAAYGGRCACCGITEEAFLTIDHKKKHSGAKYRRRIGAGSTKFYRWLRKHKYPKKNFQILCANCQLGKEKLRECPHRRK